MKSIQFGRGLQQLTFEEWCQHLESSLSYHRHKQIQFVIREWLKIYFDKCWTVCEISERLRGRTEVEVEMIDWEAPNMSEVEGLAVIG